MAIFQRPFGQKNGNIMQASTGAEVTNDRRMKVLCSEGRIPGTIQVGLF